MNVEGLYQLLAYYTICTTVAVVVIVWLTLILLRKDKHFALALSFAEVAMYVAVSTFGQSPLSRAAVALGGIRTEVELTNGAHPPYYESVLVIFLAGTLSIAMMALRTWDKQVPRDPYS